ncbi:MAG: hypothetical protein ACI4UE_05430 [Candidatus Scatovivens sp.]
MKLQSLGIIFIIIVFPMILILSYYLGLQIETVTLQNKYRNSLIDATNDAMSAFELNTANEELSNVSDSLRTIVNASTNTFVNTLSTSLGLSNANKERIQPYIPAILYTLYDGYYIYSPTKIPVILEKTKKEGETVISDGAKYSDDGALLYKQNESDDIGTTDINKAMNKTDYVLKSYMPYSATYKKATDEVTINYTLDNFINVSGIIDGIYYTKSGYYININLVTDCNIPNWTNMGQDELKEYCENEDNQINIKINDEIEIYTDRGDTEEVKKANRKAIEYYLTNTAFSNWVNDKLKFVRGDTLQSVINFSNPDSIGYSLENMNNIYHNFENETQDIFDASNDPEDEDSSFNNHKYNIIKNSIQYNLNLAISSYSEMFKGLNFEMPQLSDEEWEQITEKLSIVTFLQGLDCGLKNFNDYAIISSTNNEMTVIPEEIYYVKANEFNNETSYYHRLDCKKLNEKSDGTEYDGDFISFVSKEVKYDDVYKGDTTTGIEYEYDHKNLACYDCIVQNNYTNYSSKKIKLRAFLGIEEDIDENGITYKNNSVKSNLKKAYYTAVAKERQNLYKTTQYSKNEGIKIDTSGSSITWNSNISKAEITIEVTAPNGIVGEIKIGGNGTGKMISTSTKSTQTVEIENNGSSGNIECTLGTIQVKSIKYIYK